MMPIPSPSSFASPPPTSVATDGDNSDINTWGPYAGVRDFKGNALLILSAVFCAVILFLALSSIIRFLLCSSCHHDRDNSSSSNGEEDPAHHEEKSSNPSSSKDHVAIDVTSFSKGMELAGSGAECAICLSEFEEGEGIRVLPVCRHGFHVRCVERWLALRRSCPTCRSSAAAAASSVAVKVSSDHSDDRNLV